MSNPNKRKRCKWHKEYTETWVKTPMGIFCTKEAATSYFFHKKDEKREKAIRARHRADKERIKNIPQWIAEAQACVNKYIRTRDNGNPCITCSRISIDNNLTGSNVDAGHYRSRGSAPHLRFNLLNIHLQCVRCNRFGAGNAVDYRINLIKKIGLKAVESLETNDSYRKYSVEYLKRIKKIFNRRARIYNKLRENRSS